MYTAISRDGYGFSVEPGFDVKRFFFSATAATADYENRMQTLIHRSLKSFVSNADFYSDCPNSFYRTARKIDNLEMLKVFTFASRSASMRAIAYQVLNYEQQLRSLLPTPRSEYYQPALARLEELIWICIRVRKELKKAI